jgi:hypothetical protein
MLSATEHAPRRRREAPALGTLRGAVPSRLVRVHAEAGRYVLHSRVYPLRVLSPSLKSRETPSCSQCSEQSMEGDDGDEWQFPTARAMDVRANAPPPRAQASRKRAMAWRRPFLPGAVHPLAPNRNPTGHAARERSALWWRAPALHSAAMPGAFGHREPAWPPARPSPRGRQFSVPTPCALRSLR